MAGRTRRGREHLRRLCVGPGKPGAPTGPVYIDHVLFHFQMSGGDIDRSGCDSLNGDDGFG